jgi:hypothetical protein
MKSTRERLTAIDALCARTGRTRQQVFQSLDNTWRLPLGERCNLLQRMASTPAPKEPPALDAEAAAAVDQLEQHMATTDSAALAKFNAYSELRAKNPHAAADFMNSDSYTIHIGRGLSPKLGSNNGSGSPAPPPAA